MAKVGTAYVDVDADFTSFWRRVNRELGKADFNTRELDKTRTSLSGVDRESRRTAKGLSVLAAGGAGATATLGGFKVALAALVPLTVGFGGAVVSVTSALGPLSGLAAAAGNGLAAAAQGFTVFQLATAGVIDALKEQTTNQSRAGVAAISNAAQQRSAARAIQSAQDGVRSALDGVRDASKALTDAHRDQRRAVAELAPALSAARMRLRDLSDAATGADQALTSAKWAVKDAAAELADLLNGPDPRALATAHRAVTEALRGEDSAAQSLADAHRALNELFQPADALDVADAEDAVADALRGEERARLRLTQVIAAQDKTAQEAGISAADWVEAVKYGLDITSRKAANIDLEQARLDLADAENAVGDAARQSEHAKRALAKIEAGPDQDAVTAARRRVSDAEAQVTRAIEQTATARQELGTIEAPATAEAIARARDGLAAAEYSVAEATKDRIRAVRELAAAEAAGVNGAAEVVRAREAINDANQGIVESEHDLEVARLRVTRATQALSDAQVAAKEKMESAAVAATNLNEKMNDLPPSAQAFVRQLIAMKPKLDELRRTAADGFFPGATAGLKAAMGSFESVNKVVGQTSFVLGDAARKSGELVGSPAFGKDIEIIGGRNAKVIGTLGEALRHVISALRHVMVAAGPLTQWLADVANAWALNAAQAAKAGRESGRMAAFFERTRAVAERLGSIALHVASGLLGLGKAGRQSGDEILAAIDRAARRFDEWANSTRGQAAIKDFLHDTKELAAALGQVIGGVASAVALFAIRFLPLTTGLKLIGPYANEATTAFIAYKFALIGAGIATKVATGAAWLYSAALGVQSLNMVRWRILLAAAAVQTGVMAAAQWVLNAAMTANPIGLIVVGLAALVAGLVVAYRKSETFREVIDAAFKGVKVAFGWVLEAAKDVFGWLKDNWPLVLGILTGPIGLAVLAIVKSWDTIKSATSGAVNAVKGVVSGGWEAVRSRSASVWGTIASSLSTAWAGIKTAAGRAWGLIRDAILAPPRAARDLLVEVVTGIANRLASGWATIKSAASSAWDTVRDTVLGGLRSARDFIPDILTGMLNRLGTGFTNIIKGVREFAGDVKDKIVGAFEGAADKVKGFINTIIRAINLIPGIPNIKELAMGGTYGESKGGPSGTGQLARGGAFGRTGGVVNYPITLMGEEAPRFKEFVIPTNPAYRDRARMLLAQAAGAIGLAEGGVIAAFRSAIKKSDAGPKPSLALWEAGIVESGLRNLPYGDRDSLGALQVRAGIHGRDLAMDPLRSALAFLNRGFTGRGGAIALSNVLGSAGQVAQAVQGSAYPDRYDAVRDQAAQYLSGDKGGGGGLLGKITGAVGDLLSKGVGFILDKLPGIGDLPDWLKGMGKHVLGAATRYIKEKVEGLLSTGGGEGGGGTMTGTNAKAQTLARMFNATITSGYRTPAQNAAANGAPDSSHKKGSPSNPGAHDFVPASTALLNAALKMGAKWVDNHDYGSGLHSHVSWYRKGGMYGPYMGSYAQGTDYVPRTGMYQLHRGEGVVDAVTNAAGPRIEGLHIYVGDREITDIVRVEIEQDGRRMNAAYQAGARA